MLSNRFIESLPIWDAIRQTLDERRSVLVHGPKYFRKTRLLEQLRLHHLHENLARCAFLELTDATESQSLDYPRLFKSLLGQLGSRSRARVVDAESFAQAVRGILETSDERLLLLLRGGGSGREDEQFNLLAKLNEILHDEGLTDLRRLSVVMTDDYSLWHHQVYGPLLSSALHGFVTHLLYPLSERDVRRSLEFFKVRLESAAYLTMSVTAPTPTVQRTPLDDPALAKWVWEETGGHIGLVSEVVNQLAQWGWVLEAGSWSESLSDGLSRSPLFAWLQRALQEAPSGLAETALEYKVPHYPLELRSVRVQLLLRLGVLQRDLANRLLLCSGLIRRMIETAGAAVSPGLDRLGMVVGESGPSAFEAGGVELRDDDFVVVHLSDLHVGEQHRFCYSNRQGRRFNEDRRSLIHLLAEDLQRLKLLDRIDALVLSGDFVWSGAIEEFRLARLLIEELLGQLRIPLDRLLLVPGNHDVEWLDPEEETTLKSRDSFDDFAEHFQHDFRDGACLRSIPSLSGRRRLRLLGLDSNRVEGRKAPGIGYVSRGALDRAGHLLRGLPADGFEEELTWVTVHHHVFPATSVRLRDAEQARVTVMANTAEILEETKRWGAEAILHGHEHQAAVTIARRWPTDDLRKDFAPVVTIGAGSVGAEQHLLGPLGRNQYFVLYRRAEDLILRSRVLGPAGTAFMEDNDMLVRPR